MVIINVFIIGDVLGSISIPDTTAPNFAEMELENIKYVDFLQNIEEEKVKEIYYNSLYSEFFVADNSDGYYKVNNPDYDNFKKDMMEKGIEVLPVPTSNSTAAKGPSFLQILLMIISLYMLYNACMRYATYNRMIGKQGVTINVGPQPTQRPVMQDKEQPSNIKTFKDIAGLTEVKKDTKCLIDFLKNAEKYKEAGATLPRGVIFYGPPGTGKTLLAKAIAGEAGVPFHYVSGSDFVEMYVGVGAKRIRELFDTARKKAPCIIFIDEIDAIGGKRGRDDSNGEDRKTLNALLTEMDGFKPTENIIVIGATNRIEDLDAALVRPGRFTNKFCIPLPETAKERKEIIELYSKKKKFSDEVDFDALSRETIGFSPAAIESLLNEAAIISVQDEKPCIDKQTIEKAMYKILMSGHMKENQADRDKEELEIVAWHEAGHALVGKLTGKEIPKVTIIASTSGAGGVTFSTPRKTGLYSVEDLKNEVMELYAGRVAEMFLLKDKTKVTTGASNDIERATSIIHKMVTSYGMADEFGLLSLSKLKVNQDKVLEKEVEISKELEQETGKLLKKHYDLLKEIAEELLEKEVLYEADLNNIIKRREMMNQINRGEP